MQRVTVTGDGLGICYMTNRWVKGDGWWVSRVANFFVCLFEQSGQDGDVALPNRCRYVARF